MRLSLKNKRLNYTQLQTSDWEDVDFGEQSMYESEPEELDGVETGIAAQYEASLSGEDEESLPHEDSASLPREDKESPLDKCDASLPHEDEASVSDEDELSVFQPPARSEKPVIVPHNGQLFGDEDEFIMAISEYARDNGFSIRRDRILKNKAGKVRKRDLVCSWARTPALNKGQPVDRNKPSQSTDCSFRVRASFDSRMGKWKMIFVNLLHNHAMVAPERRRFMSSERKLPDEVKSEVLQLRRAGISVPQIRSVLKVKFGKDRVWLYDNVYNFLYQQTAEPAKRALDAQSLVQALQELQADYTQLEFRFDLYPDTQRLRRIIWMFPEQKLAYCRFHDVIVFDNTYSTNYFRMPFGVFTGVNNHGQSVCFAGSLVDREDGETFIWLFNSFLDMVSNNAPDVLLTDDHKAIGLAIETTFARYGTRHRLCYWHLFRNLSKNLSASLGSQWDNFLRTFHECLNTNDEQTFISRWTTLKREHPKAKRYLERMEHTDKKWACCYNQDVFMADMTTTQRGESMNNLLKYYMDSTTSLSTFLEAFTSALEARDEAEEFLKFKEENYALPSRTGGPFELQAYSLFTWYAFKKFQDQLVLSQSYRCSEISR
jgi:hypothetical protein